MPTTNTIKKMNDLITLYKEYIRRCTDSKNSVENYSDFKRLNDLIIDCIDQNFKRLENCTVSDVDLLQSIYDKLLTFEKFELFKDNKSNKDKDFVHIGGGQYYNALKTFIRFLNAMKLFSSNKQCGSSTYNDLPLQQIFYGAPGTGKSNTIKQEVEDKDRIHFRTTFHPDSDYSTFVGCYKPTKNAAQVVASIDDLIKKCSEYAKRAGYNNQNLTQFGFDYCRSLEKASKEDSNFTYNSLLSKAGVTDTSASSYITAGMELYSTLATKIAPITYEFVPQAFTKAYCEAWNRLENNEPVFLIIEEINRGNCAQIFGDIFQLLDRETDGNRCGFSTYPIDADEDLKLFMEKAAKADGTPWLTNKDGIKDGKLCLPPNLHIWATMNTSDQSLFPIDSAFKRRWDWKYVPIDTKKENWTIKVNSNQYSWSSFLEIINEKILAKTQSEDKQLGFYFCKADNNIISAERFVSKVLFYIYNDVYKDFGFDDAFFKNGDEKLSFQGYYKPNGEINEDKVEALLKNLNIKIVTEENDDDIESDSENAGKKEHKETLVSVTLNGETIKSSTQFDTYLDTIKAIGTDKVGAHIESMKFKRYGCPLASTVQMDGIKNSEGEYSYVSAGQYHFVKGAKSYTLIRVLEELKNIMNLDLEIEYK